MTDLTVTPFKILICFAFALATTIAVRFFLKEKRDLWFKRSKSRFVLTIRGSAGEYLSLGYPKTWQGAAVTAALLAVLCAEIYLILKFF